MKAIYLAVNQDERACEFCLSIDQFSLVKSRRDFCHGKV